MIQRLEEYGTGKLAEIAVPARAQHQDITTLSWEEGSKNMDYNDADFKNMLMDLDMEFIINVSTLNECQY